MAAYRKILILISFALLMACQEVYNPDDINADLKIPVVEGYIHDGPGPYRVELFWAAEFYDRSYTPISGALVTISDNEGNNEILTEIVNGRYFTDKNGIRGTAGRIYTLHIELPDGSIYESAPAQIQPPEEIDTIYAEIGKKEYTSRNLYGDLMIKRKGGLYVYADIKTEPGDNRFFRFYSRVVTQTQYSVLYESLGAISSVYVYCWNIWSLNEIVNVKSTILSSNEQVIKRHNLGFLPYSFDPRPQNDTTGPILPKGWIVSTTAFSIQKDAYEYYSSVVKQLEAEERMFDPVPSQVKGNIHCLSDTTKLVLGLFEVASKTTRHTAFNWGTGWSEYTILNLPEYKAPVVDSCQDSIMPDFWIIM